MTFDSIKSRLALMTCVCVLGMGLMVLSQHYFTQRLVTISQQQGLLLRLGQDLLQMRRHEKDFLLRHRPSYFDLFEQRAARFMTRLKKLGPLFTHYELPDTLSGELAESLNTYQLLFKRVVDLQTRIGLNADHGLQGALGEVEAKLLSQPQFNTGLQARVRLDEARLNIRNFQLSKSPAYASQALASIHELRNTFSQAPTVNHLIASYQTTFTALFNAYQQLGYTQNEGLRGAFRREAHKVEAQLKQIDVALQPIIQAQQADVQVYSIAIAVTTSVALLLLLLKSFATFQKAFGNFVMFFYRCKTQYPKIDPRKLGFAEFKSLAQLANEMVESRREIEQRLATAESQLHAHNQAK